MEFTLYVAILMLIILPYYCCAILTRIVPGVPPKNDGDATAIRQRAQRFIYTLNHNKMDV